MMGLGEALRVGARRGLAGLFKAGLSFFES